jgi:hypothetical protein
MNIFRILLFTLLLTQITAYTACVERVKKWWGRPPLAAESTHEEAVYIASDDCDCQHIDHIGVLDNVGNFHILAHRNSTSASPDNPFASSFRYMEQAQLGALYAALKEKHNAIAKEHIPAKPMPPAEEVVERLLGKEGEKLSDIALKTRRLIRPGLKKRPIYRLYVKQAPERVLTLPGKHELAQKQPASASWLNPTCIVYQDEEKTEY